MAPLKSSLSKSVGKLIGVFRDRDLSLRGIVQSSRFVNTDTPVTMYLWGAGGGDRASGAEPGNGGSGGFMQVSGAFAQSDTLYVYVGNCGLSPYNGGSSMTPGIFGGAPTDAGGSYSGAGGGACYVTLNGEKTNGSGSGTVIAVAGGGGGNGYNGGGGGGYPNGGTGGEYDGATGGGGGTQSAGGTGGNNDHSGSASNGAFLLGGTGGPGSSTVGGGGGGGYYGGGGGGGANSNSGGGGGGGSSYGNPAYVTVDDHATGNSSGGITGPGPLVTTHLAPNWHNRGGGGAYPAPERNPFGSATSSYGGKARAVITTPTWTRTVNYSGVVEQIPMNYSPAGLNFVVAANAQYDGPYDYGMGWGQVGGKGCTITSRASNSSIYYEFTFSGSNSDFSDVEVFTHCGNGVTQLTGSFNGGSSFTFPSTTTDTGTPSGSLAPHLPSGNITSFRITHGGGSGNSHLYIHALKINGVIVDFGRNYI